MILLRDFALFILPAAIAAGGWFYAIDVRKRVRPGRAPRRSAIPPASLAP